MAETVRPDKISRSSSSKGVYAVAGNPVEHSRSPEIHQMFAEQTNQNIEYGRLLVPEGAFAQTVEGYFAGGGGGLNVTLPCKGDAWTWVGSEHCSVVANRAQAVNTIVRRGEGYEGHNTDGIGLINDLRWHEVPLEGARILILGAGGAVRGILPSLQDTRPASIVIANRTPGTAMALAALMHDGRVHVKGGGLELANPSFDLVINGTSSGLEGDIPAIPESVVRNAWCYDLMYGPKATFHIWTRARTTRRSIDGLGMLIEQAAEAFFLWRGVRPDTAPVRQRMMVGGVA